MLLHFGAVDYSCRIWINGIYIGEHIGGSTHAVDLCRNKDTWVEAWKEIEDKYKEYNWIHSYPNAAAEVIALWFGNNDFEETCHIIAMEGRDVDCTAAPALNALLCMKGISCVDERWIKPIGQDIYTVMRKMQHLTIDELCNMTVNAVRKACL